MNYLIHLICKSICNIIYYKKKSLYFRLIKFLSLNNFCYSYDGFKIYGDNLADITFKYTVGGFYMSKFQKTISLINKPFYFLDIGSNIGYFSLVVGKNHNCKKIFTFEPNPKIFKSLKKNLIYNLSSVKFKAYKAAISKNYRKLKFYIDLEDSGSSSLIKKKNDKVIYVNSYNYRIFNQIYNKLKDIDIITKIDVEGKDLEVLKELKKSKLFKNIRLIYIETKNNDQEIKNIKKNLRDFALEGKYPIIDSSKSYKQVDLQFSRL